MVVFTLFGHQVRCIGADFSYTSPQICNHERSVLGKLSELEGILPHTQGCFLEVDKFLNFGLPQLNQKEPI